MPVTDIARRVYDHTWKLDPIIRSLLDTDFYKLLMLQMIWERYSTVTATFSLISRDKNIRLATEIPIEELRAQLDHARTLRFNRKEMLWLRGNRFSEQSQMFKPKFLKWLENFQLPEYNLSQKGDHYILEFSGLWMHTSMWEIPALAIVNELRSRAVLQNQGRFALDVIYARAKTKVWNKLEKLQKLPHLQIADFGTRRRHSFLWQNWCVEALSEGLGSKFRGSSNILLAMNNGFDPIGTNAHELPMVATALARNDNERIQAPYKIMKDWQDFYKKNLLIALPDTYGTAFFLKHAPDWVSDWKGFRPDSAPPIAGGEQIIQWWNEKKKNPLDKMLVFSDSLDVPTIIQTYKHFHGRVQMSFGWGTNLTNDFLDCTPKKIKDLNSTSLVCKVTQANGIPVVKLSDNLSKATGSSKEIKNYITLFN